MVEKYRDRTYKDYNILIHIKYISYKTILNIN